MFPNTTSQIRGSQIRGHKYDRICSYTRSQIRRHKYEVEIIKKNQNYNRGNTRSQIRSYMHEYEVVNTRSQIRSYLRLYEVREYDKFSTSYTRFLNLVYELKTSYTRLSQIRGSRFKIPLLMFTVFACVRARQFCGVCL